MAKWLNHVAIAAPRNGTNTHTVDPSSGTIAAGAHFTPTAGRLLVVLVTGAVTSTTPTGWTLPAGGSAINNVGLYLWHRVAAGGDALTTAHNGSNYPVIFDFYEFPSDTTFIGAAGAGNVSAAGGAGPSLSGLTASANLRAAVLGQAVFGATPNSYTWSGGTEAVDSSIPLAGTDGYGYSLAYVEDDTSSTFSLAATAVATTPTVERLVFALGVPATQANDGTLSATAPLATSSTTGVSTNPGSLAGPAPMVSADLAGSSQLSGSLDADAPLATAVLAGSSANPGTTEATAPLVTSTIASAEVNAGTLDATAPLATSAIAGVATNPGALAGTTPLVIAGIGPEATLSPERTLTVAPESRIRTVTPEHRTLVVTAETRTLEA